MAFTDTQIRLLAGKLPEKHIRTREERGLTLSYIEGWHVIDEANRVFGFDAWDRETVLAECVWADGRREPKACAYAVRVRIRVRAGESTVCRDGSGVGHGEGATLGEAHERALKEAETDATKRALTTFGNLFGLALYDKAQNGVRRSPKPTVPSAPDSAPISWVVVSPTGELLGRHINPQDFCACLRAAIEASSEPEALDMLWLRNTGAVEQLRVVCPTLRTAQGRHYAEVLERLYRQRLIQLKAAPEPEGVIDKSVLAIAMPKRVRDPAHRRYVASLPCLICGRMPSQAHHLRFAQPRAMGSKVSDEFTVPLCGIHHRALHDDGAEEKWWEGHRIDAMAEAEKLWRQSRGEQPAEAAAELQPTGSGT